MPRLSPLVCAAVLLVSPCAPSTAAQQPDVRLEGAGPAEIEQALSRLLKSPVQVVGAKGKTVSLSLPAPSSQALDRVAAALGGTWRARLQVRPGTAERAAEPDEPAQPLTVGIRDLPASRAFATIARQLKIDADVQRPLEQRVSIFAVQAPGYQVLDQIAAQARATWSLAYVITAPDAPPPPPVRPAAPEQPEQPEPSLQPAPAVSRPVRQPDLRAILHAGVRGVLRASPAEREAAVRDFADLARRHAADLAPLPAADRRTRLQPLQALLNQWQRTLRGLAPGVRQQLQPVGDVLERHFRLR